MDNADEIRARIAERLEVLDLRIQTASLKAGLGQTTLRDFMTGKSQNITVRTINKLAPVLQASAEWIHTGAASGNAEESEFLELLHRIPRDKRRIVMDVARGFIPNDDAKKSG